MYSYDYISVLLPPFHDMVLLYSDRIMIQNGLETFPLTFFGKALF